MTRIETLFGGLLAAGILAVFAFVFFGASGSSEPAPRVGDDAPRARVLGKSAAAALLRGDEDDYSAPATACECYDLGYDLARAGVDLEGVLFNGQLQICYDRIGTKAADAFGEGARAALAEPRERRSCRVSDYL